MIARDVNSVTVLCAKVWNIAPYVKLSVTLSFLLVVTFWDTGAMIVLWWFFGGYNALFYFSHCGGALLIGAFFPPHSSQEVFLSAARKRDPPAGNSDCCSCFFLMVNFNVASLVRLRTPRYIFALFTLLETIGRFPSMYISRPV